MEIIFVEEMQISIDEIHDKMVVLLLNPHKIENTKESSS